MLPVSLRRWINIVGTTAAIVTATVVPLGYGLVVYQEDTAALSLRAHINATRLSRYIETQGSMWLFHRAQLAELIDLSDRKDVSIHQRVYDATGTIIIDEGPALANPTIARSEPLIVGTAVVGRIEVEASAQRLLHQTIFIASGSLLLGIVIFCALRWLPLKLLDQTFAKLRQREAELAS